MSSVVYMSLYLPTSSFPQIPHHSEKIPSPQGFAYRVRGRKINVQTGIGGVDVASPSYIAANSLSMGVSFDITAPSRRSFKLSCPFLIILLWSILSYFFLQRP